MADSLFGAVEQIYLTLKFSHIPDSRPAVCIK